MGDISPSRRSPFYFDEGFDQGAESGAAAVLDVLSITAGDLSALGTVPPGIQSSLTVTGAGGGGMVAGKLTFTGDGAAAFEIVAVNGDDLDTPHLCEDGDFYFAAASGEALVFRFATRVFDMEESTMLIGVVRGNGTVDDTANAVATVILAIIGAIVANIPNLQGIWFAKPGVAHDQGIANDEHILVDQAGLGAPDFIATLGGTGRWKYKTDDNPTSDFQAVIDCGVAHLDGEFAAIASALAHNSYCGGMIFRVTAALANPDEETILALSGTDLAPYNISNGAVGNGFLMTYYPSPMKLVGPDGSITYGATNVDWCMLQWRRLANGHVHYYCSKLGSTFKGLGEVAASSSDPWDTGLQIGHGGSVGPGINLRVACVWSSYELALSEAATKAVFDDGV